ncbi:NAF1 [Lepeophtheirus salmonis]|uniref:H/ACA ribonucleoprotein complex subunit n=1 Tax=Lepeophtheirus salmonis TaxID=72036 RepID=A0A7R8CH68_LEPSM|nr:NAF1 [Lepeophtheirus salmonis]CAF2764805.1 NAF1 [Lepeophtheirus salmonis]
MNRVEIKAADSGSEDEIQNVPKNNTSKNIVEFILDSLIKSVVLKASHNSSSEDSSSEEENTSSKGPCPTVKGELNVSDLPPIEELYISVPQEQTEFVGKVFSIVDSLVVVKSLPGIPTIDLDSVLFLDRGKIALGSVFDVIGPVNDPFYVVRFNSMKHVESRGIEIGKELRAMKGSDASWQDDIEPPIDFIDYSDDDEERQAKRAVKRKRVYKEPNPSQIAHNPFYRRSRAYNPRANGPITWNSWNSQYREPPPPGTSQRSDVPIWNNSNARGYWSKRDPT